MKLKKEPPRGRVSKRAAHERVGTQAGLELAMLGLDSLGQDAQDLAILGRDLVDDVGTRTGPRRDPGDREAVHVGDILLQGVALHDLGHEDVDLERRRPARGVDDAGLAVEQPGRLAVAGGRDTDHVTSLGAIDEHDPTAVARAGIAELDVAGAAGQDQDEEGEDEEESAQAHGGTPGLGVGAQGNKKGLSNRLR